MWSGIPISFRIFQFIVIHTLVQDPDKHSCTNILFPALI